MLKGAILLLRFASAVFKWYERRGLIRQGAKEEISKQIAKIAASVKMAHETRKNIEALEAQRIEEILMR